jgi:hypothetical protein
VIGPGAGMRAAPPTDRPRRSRGARILGLLTVALTAVTITGSAGPSPRPWAEGADNGAWHTVFTGNGVVDALQTTTIVLSPQAPIETGTHSALVVSTGSYRDLDVTIRLRTSAQLRQPAPNPWEVAWLLWHYTDHAHFYYVALKSIGCEVGKEDPAYPGGQRFLATGPRPFHSGQWYDVRIRQAAATVTVWADGATLTTVTDAENPYPGGKIGLYSEDAVAEFRPLRICCPL